MSDKLVRSHTNVSNRAKAKDTFEHRSVYKSVLDNPFTVPWYVFPCSDHSNVIRAGSPQGPRFPLTFRMPSYLRRWPRWMAWRHTILVQTEMERERLFVSMTGRRKEKRYSLKAETKNSKSVQLSWETLRCWKRRI